ncbi:hypothetical protein ABH931_006292 [Streptacidiphilus sp. MAP12-33]
MIDLTGRTLHGPQPGAAGVHPRHRARHTQQVFHGLPRTRVPTEP